MATAELPTGTWTLSQCVAYALRTNTALRQTALERERSRLNLQAAQGARIPTLNGQATQGFSFGRSIDPFSNQFITQNIRSNNFQLGTNWTFFNGLALTQAVRQNRSLLQASELDLETARQTLVLNVTRAYLNLVLAEEQLNNAESRLQTSQAQLEQTEKLVNAGRQAIGTLYTLRAQLAADKLSLTQQRNVLQLAQLALRQQLELPLQTPLSVQRPEQSLLLLPDTLTQSAELYYQQALQQRPEFAAARARTQAAALAQRVARGNYWPRLSLNFNISTGYSSARTLSRVEQTTTTTTIGYLASDPTQLVLSDIPSFTSSRRDYPFGQQLSDNFGQNLNLVLTVPLVNNLTVRTNVARADVNLSAALLEETRQLNLLRQSVEQAWTDAEAARLSYRAALERLDAQKLATENTQEQFRLGLIGVLDQLTAQNNLNQALTDLSAARFDFFFKYQVLEFYRQGTLSID